MEGQTMTRICLVEDDREIAKNLVLLLRSEGFAVTHAPTREEAFAAAEEHKFDLAPVSYTHLGQRWRGI